MPINHWLSPYMMEASAKTPIPTSAAAAAAAVFCRQSTAFGLNLNHDEEEELLEETAAAAMDDGGGGESSINADLPKEPLFEKPLTPSDVGKLNRLVIPKQHAEKYFPLNGGGGDGGEKGLLLGFEDEAGKPWRFRYSYWNSSQSYVLTKGWSRFVKEKRLDAGDIVLFARHPNDVGRLFIGWRRRSGGAAPQPPCGGGGGWTGILYTSAHPYPTQPSSSVLYQNDCPHAEGQTREKNGNSKRLRLFGVNLEWDEDESEPSTPKGLGEASSKAQAHEHYSSHRRSGHMGNEGLWMRFSSSYSSAWIRS